MAANADAGRFRAIYLNDHLAGATLGVELGRRLRSSNQGDAEFGEPLAQLCAEIEEDHRTLTRLMEHQGVSRDPVKPVLAKVAERLGRLKLNGRIRGYSPLSRVLELEVLSGLVGGKLQLWNAPRAVLRPVPRRLRLPRTGRPSRQPRPAPRRPTPSCSPTGTPSADQQHPGHPISHKYS